MKSGKTFDCILKIQPNDAFWENSEVKKRERN